MKEKDNGKRTTEDSIQMMFFWVLCSMVVVCIIAVIINDGLDFSSVPFLLIFAALIGVCFINRKRIIDFMRLHKKLMRILGIIALIVGLVLRFSFLLLQDRFNTEFTLSDTGVHWYGAQQLIDNGSFDKEIGDYEATFPYLFSYTGMLALFMKIFGANYFAILALNISFDVIGAIGLYVLFKKWSGNKDAGLISAVVWMLNPLEIIFCSLPLAIVIVNSLFILAILCMYGVIHNLSSYKRIILFAAMFGLVLAIGNAYRPFFIVFLLAMIVYYVISILRQHVCLKKYIVSILVAAITMILVGLLPNAIHMHFNSYYNGEKSSAGWSVFVGANYKTHGKWNSDDRDYFFGPVLMDDADGNIAVAQNMIMEHGIKRYGEMVVEGELVPHLFNKMSVLFADERNTIYDFPHVFRISTTNGVYNLVQDCLLVFYYLMIGLFAAFIFRRTVRYGKYRNRNGGFELIIVIVFIGFFFAALLVEVMNRYSLPYTVLIIMLALKFLLDYGNSQLKLEAR